MFYNIYPDDDNDDYLPLSGDSSDTHESQTPKECKKTPENWTIQDVALLTRENVRRQNKQNEINV